MDEIYIKLCYIFKSFYTCIDRKHFKLSLALLCIAFNPQLSIIVFGL